MRITKRQLRRVICEAIEDYNFSDREASPHDGSMYGEPEGGDVSRTPEVQQMLMDAGFNADGSFGADGYPGPDDWQLYAPKDMEEAANWIQAALDMNAALRKAESALESGQISSGEHAFYEYVYPEQSHWSKTGAADTEGREVGAAWLEKQGYEW